MINHDRVGVFLTYRELYPSNRLSLSAFIDRLSELDGLQLVRLLAVVSWYVGEDVFGRSHGTELGFFDEFADPALAKRVRAWLSAGKATRVLHRATIPSLYQLIMLAQQKLATQVRSVELREVPELILKCNDYLEADVPFGQAQPSKGEEPAVGALFFRNGFYQHRPSWGSASARQWALIRKGLPAVRAKYPNEWVDVEALSHRLLDLGPLELQTIVLAIMSKYSSLTRAVFDEHPEQFFLTKGAFANVSNQALVAKVPAALQYLSQSWNAHVAEMGQRAKGPAENVQQFFSIYNHPLMEEGERYWPLDIEFLRAQSHEGWYWAVVRELIDRKDLATMTRLRGAMGRAFEWCASEVARSCRGRNLNGLWLDWDGELDQPQGEAQPDIVALEGGTLFVIELTSSAVRPIDAVSADPNPLRKALERVWYGSEETSAKLHQLERVWTAAKEQRLQVPGLTWNHVKRIVPVLVSLRYVPVNIGSSPWLKKIIREHSADPEFARLVCVFDAEDWEDLCQCGIGRMPWAGALDQWRHSDASDETFMNFRNLLVGVRERHPVVNTWFREFWQEVASTLGWELREPA